MTPQEEVIIIFVLIILGYIIIGRLLWQSLEPKSIARERKDLNRKIRI